jgi:hypothetical protein
MDLMRIDYDEQLEIFGKIKRAEVVMKEGGKNPKEKKNG